MEGIEELVELFRKFGGKFENTALGYREEDGFYVYTLDSSQDAVVSCPARLLVDIDDVDVSKDGLFIANPDKYGSRMEFLEKYFTFHFNRKTLGRYFEMKRQVDSMSSRDLSLISGIYPPEHCWSGGCGELEFVKKQIFNAHQIHHFGKDVLMPFVTFLNYAKDGNPYDVKEDAITVSGRFNDEVLARYNLDDSISIAGMYGFIADTIFAYSIPLRMEIPNGTLVNITRDLELTISQDGFKLPLISKEHNSVNVGWFPLYSDVDPLYPAKVAQMIAGETALSAEVVLNFIFQANLSTLVPIAFQLRESESQYAQLAAAAAQRQLEVIGGTRK